MTFLDLAKNRYSVRKYKSDKVPRAIAEQIVEAGRLAPSACNKQPWHFLLIDDEQILKKLHSVYNREWFASAPCAIIAYGNHNLSWKRSYDAKDHCDIDVAIATEHMCLQAADLGLGSCWICHFDTNILNSIIDVEEGWEAIAIISLGYPDGQDTPTKNRVSLEDVLSYNKMKDFRH